MTKQYDIEDVCVKKKDLPEDLAQKLVDLCNNKGAKFWKSGSELLAFSCDSDFLYLEKDEDGFWDVNGWTRNFRPDMELVSAKVFFELVEKTLGDSK